MSQRAIYDVEPEWSPARKEAFALYRDFGPSRSLRAVSEKLGKSETLINRWSMEDQWVRRVAAWDAEQDRIAQEAVSEKRRQLSEKHALAIESTLTVLMQPAVALAQKIEQGDRSLTELDPITLANLAGAAGKQLPALVQASRLVHGFSTENVAVESQHRVKVEGASPDELDHYLTGYDDGTKAITERAESIEAADYVDAEAPDDD